MPFENPQAYNDPHTTPSTVGSQIRIDLYYRKALVEAAKEMYFGQMADVRAMPKNMGKTIKQYHYLPILDDRNIKLVSVQYPMRSVESLKKIFTDTVNSITGAGHHTVNVR